MSNLHARSLLPVTNVAETKIEILQQLLSLLALNGTN